MNDHVLFLAWQSPTTRRWFTVGRLRRLPEGTFEFVYTAGFSNAVQAGGMAPLAGMPQTTQRYVSAELFPHFQNRIMSRSREEFPLHLEGMGLAGETDPLAILARSGGKRVTDSFQVFAQPKELHSDVGVRQLCIEFFTHGFRYMPTEHSVIELLPNAELFLMWDFQNREDASAVMIRTKDNYNVGYVPRFYSQMLLRLRELNMPMAAKIVHTSQPGTPSWFRVFCTVIASWPAGFQPLETDDEFRPLA